MKTDVKIAAIGIGITLGVAWGGSYAENVVRDKTEAPTSPLAYPLFCFGKILARKVMLPTEIPSFLKQSKELRHIKIPLPSIIQNFADKKEYTFQYNWNFPKEVARLGLGSAAGYCCLLAQGIEKCLSACQSTFLSEELEANLNSGLSTQKEILDQFITQTDRIGSSLEAEEGTQDQQLALITDAEESADDQTGIIERTNEAQDQASISIYIPNEELYEKKLFSFIQQLPTLPSHEKRVDLLKTLLAEFQSQKALHQELSDKLPALLLAYQQEEAQLQDLMAQVEQDSHRAGSDTSLLKDDLALLN